MCKPGGRILLLQHGHGTWNFINNVLDNGAGTQAGGTGAECCARCAGCPCMKPGVQTVPAGLLPRPRSSALSTLGLLVEPRHRAHRAAGGAAGRQHEPLALWHDLHAGGEAAAGCPSAAELTAAASRDWRCIAVNDM